MQATQRAPFPWLSLLQMLVGGLALVMSWSLAALLLVAAVTQADNRLGSLGQGLAMALTGALFLPSLILGFLRVIRPDRPSRGVRLHGVTRVLFWAGLVFWLAVLIGGQLVFSSGLESRGLLVFLTPLAAAIPIYLLYRIGKHDLPAGSPQRTWGLFNAGMVIGPLFSLIVELAVLIVVLVIVIVVVSTDQSLAAQLGQLAERLEQTGGDLEKMAEALRPLLSRPEVLGFGFLYIAVFVPLVEEFFKPLGLLLVGRRLTPAEGFVGGLLSGAGFALFESLNTISSQAANDWSSLALARAGTDLVHLTASGLVGWGIARSFQARRPWPWLGAYFAAALIHGLWNAVSLTFGIGPLLNVGAGNHFVPENLAGTILVVLSILLLVLLLVMNRRLRVPPLPHPSPLEEGKESA